MEAAVIAPVAVGRLRRYAIDKDATEGPVGVTQRKVDGGVALIAHCGPATQRGGVEYLAAPRLVFEIRTPIAVIFSFSLHLFFDN